MTAGVGVTLRPLDGEMVIPQLCRWKFSQQLGLFRCILRLRRYKRKSVEAGVFRRGMGHFEHKFQTEEAVAHQPLLVSEH